MELQISISGEDPVEGVVVAPGDAAPVVFTGWLDLLGILEQLVAGERSTAG